MKKSNQATQREVNEDTKLDETNEAIVGPYFGILPIETILQILFFLDTKSLAQLAQTNRSFRAIVNTTKEFSFDKIDQILKSLTSIAQDANLMKPGKIFPVELQSYYLLDQKPEITQRLQKLSPEELNEGIMIVKNLEKYQTLNFFLEGDSYDTCKGCAFQIAPFALILILTAALLYVGMKLNQPGLWALGIAIAAVGIPSIFGFKVYAECRYKKTLSNAHSLFSAIPTEDQVDEETPLLRDSASRALA